MMLHVFRQTNARTDMALEFCLQIENSKVHATGLAKGSPVTLFCLSGLGGGLVKQIFGGL